MKELHSSHYKSYIWHQKIEKKFKSLINRTQQITHQLICFSHQIS